MANDGFPYPVDCPGNFNAKAKAIAPGNQWGEPDEFPIVGRWHVRHTIPAAEGTGHLFGKNFDSLSDALAFCGRQTGHCRLLAHVEGGEVAAGR